MMRNAMNESFDIYLADLVNDFEGHFYIMQALHKLTHSHYIDTKEKKIVVKKNPIKGTIIRMIMYHRVLTEANKRNGMKVIHFITGDKFYFLPILFSPESKKTKVVMTLHRCPTNLFYVHLLKNFANRISKVIVLGEAMKDDLNRMGIYNVEVIDHPSFFDYTIIDEKAELRKRFSVTDDNIVISALGGTRYDKGLDLLLDSFAYISPRLKNRITLCIAGAEQDFKKEYIEGKIKKYKIKAIVDLRYLSDIEFCEYVKLTDWIALPYRSSFKGVSGPMTEGLSLGIPCIVPKGSILHKFANTFGLCVPFDTENVEALAQVLVNIVENRVTLNPHDTERLSEKRFIEKHFVLYNSLFAKP